MPQFQPPPFPPPQPPPLQPQQQLPPQPWRRQCRLIAPPRRHRSLQKHPLRSHPRAPPARPWNPRRRAKAAPQKMPLQRRLPLRRRIVQAHPQPPKRSQKVTRQVHPLRHPLLSLPPHRSRRQQPRRRHRWSAFPQAHGHPQLPPRPPRPHRPSRPQKKAPVPPQLGWASARPLQPSRRLPAP